VSAIERLVSMAENENPRAAAITDALSDLSDVREWAEAMTLLADALEEVGSSAESWQEAEDRESKADTREELLAALNSAADAYADLQALAPIDLGPEVTL
jgi:hypothetical protein